MPDNETKDFTDMFGHLQSDGLGGFEQLTADLVALPFLRILQTLSPQLKRTKPEYNELAAEGLWCNSSNNQVYGDTIDVVVGRFEHLYLEWKLKRGGLLGRWSVEDVSAAIASGVITSDGRKLLTRNNSEVSETYTYALVIKGHEQDGVMLLSTSSTLLKPSRQLNRILLNSFLPNGRRALPYYMEISLKTTAVSNEKGDWYTFVPTFKNWVDAPTLALVSDVREHMPDSAQIDYKTLAIDVGSEEGDEHDGIPF